MTPPPSRIAGLALLGAGSVLPVAYIILRTTVPPGTWARMTEVSAAGVIIACLFVLASWVMSALRIHVLAYRLGSPISLTRAVGATLSAEFGATTTPVAIGEIPFKMMGLRYAGMPWHRAMTLATVNVMTDVLVALAFLPVAIMALFDSPEWLRAIATVDSARLAPVVRSAFWIIPLILGMMLVLLVCRRRWLLRPRKGSFTQRIAATWRLWTDTLPVSDHSTHWLFGWDFILATGQWVCRYAVLPCLIAAFGYGVYALPVLFVQGLLLVLTMLVMVPGGGGSIELAMLALLGVIMPVEIAAIVVVLWRFLTYYMHMVAGALAVAFMVAFPENTMVEHVTLS